MKIIAVDDEKYALLALRDAVCAALPNCTCSIFLLPNDAISFVKENPADIAFLDIELGCMNGIALAKKLKDIQKDISIIFVTGYQQYAIDAFTIHASGYLLKPVKSEDVKQEIDYIKSLKKHSVFQTSIPKIKVKTFGGFDVFVNGKPLLFRRAKSKELLAYLIDRRGNSVTSREACCILFEDGIYDSKRSGYFRSLVSDLRKTLLTAGIENILIRSRNSLAIDPACIDCDAYRFLEGDVLAINAYRSDYMMQYSWSEFSVGLFESKMK